MHPLRAPNRETNQPNRRPFRLATRQGSRPLARFLGVVLVLGGCAHQPTAGPPTDPGAADADATAEAAPASPEPMDPRRVVYALRGSEEQYRKCFMQAIGQRGVVETEFAVSQTGGVTRLQVVRSTIGSASVVDCLTKHLWTQKFGDLSGPKQGRWTFVFRLTDPVPPKEFRWRLAQARKDSQGAVSVNPKSPGSLDAAAIADVAHAGYPLFAHCYRDSIDRKEDNGGVLRLQLEIDQRGRVTDIVDAGSVLPDPFAVDCIAEGFFAMDFPKPSGGSVEAVYRLDFD